MPKAFFTETDIEDLVKRGITSLEINEDTVLTDLAYEKAGRLGLQLVRQQPENPPAAPIRPYISQVPSGLAGRPSVGSDLSKFSSPAPAPVPQVSASELHQRIRGAVIARLGSQVDPALLDVIISRVLNSTGIK